MRSNMHFPLTLSFVQDKKCPSLCLPAGMQKVECPGQKLHRIVIIASTFIIVSHLLLDMGHTAWPSDNILIDTLLLRGKAYRRAISSLDWSKIYQIHEKELRTQCERLTFFFLFGNFAIFTFMMRIKSDVSVFIRLAVNSIVSSCLSTPLRALGGREKWIALEVVAAG